MDRTVAWFHVYFLVCEGSYSIVLIYLAST